MIAWAERAFDQGEATITVSTLPTCCYAIRISVSSSIEVHFDDLSCLILSLKAIFEMERSPENSKYRFVRALLTLYLSDKRLSGSACRHFVTAVRYKVFEPLPVPVWVWVLCLWTDWQEVQLMVQADWSRHLDSDLTQSNYRLESHVTRADILDCWTTAFAEFSFLCVLLLLLI